MLGHFGDPGGTSRESKTRSKEGIQSSFSYVGASNFDEFHSRVEFVEVTYAGMVEARPHLL